MAAADNVTLVPYRDDILRIAAEHILTRCAASLPDCTACSALLPALQFAPRLRRHLLQAAGQRGFSALLGPTISTLDQWLGEHATLTREIPDRARRELMLVEALQQYPAVFPGIDPWHIASDLIALFDELTFHRIIIPDDLGTFTTRLQQAYGISGRIPEPLGMEAAIVHRLWQAWHAQLAQENLLDPGMAHLQRLADTRNTSQADRLFLVGFSDFSTAELEWVTSRLQGNHAELILRAQPRLAGDIAEVPVAVLLDRLGISPPAAAPADAASQCLDAAFQIGTEAPAQRARDFSTQFPASPLTGRMAIFPAGSAEQEARAIDIQVRQWLLAEHQPIGIVTEDRRLARRVRALLERAGVDLQDSGGWALSTTSAAAALESWLEVVEEDFAHQPLLDVLKSPFLFPQEDREQHLNTVHRLEQDIILHENIARGLERYRKHVAYRLKRLPLAWTRHTAEAIKVLLNRLDQAAEPLREFLASGSVSPARMLASLRDSLQALGMWETFATDPAGRQLLDEWDRLYQAAQHSGLSMKWTEFRAWLGAALERQDFHPSTGDSPVVLLTLQQAWLGRFAGLVIGACNREHLPGTAAGSPFFNDGVRQELELPAWPEEYQLRLHRFRGLLESAPRVLLTWCREEAGEPRLPSPWVEAVQTFHFLAWNDPLPAGALENLVNHPAAQVHGNHPLPPPLPAGHPAPVLDQALVPHTLSASSHQRLIDCPYRFFAADGLRLKPREAVSEALEKSDYGERIHRCLEAFHGGVEKFPGPFGQRVSTANRPAAIALLQRIGHAVFSSDLEDNFEHRAWLKRWVALIPEYIDWEIRRQERWAVAQVEQQAETRLRGEDCLRGRLDRIDAGPDGLSIIDYKTGRVPRQDAVDAGEAIQLPSYALLTGTFPEQVGYLGLDRNISDRISLAGEELQALAGAVRERLITVLDAIHHGAPLPAWGDAAVCRHCEMDGLCRQQSWLDDSPPGTGDSR